MKYLKTIGFEFIILIISTLLITILYYFNIINNNVNNILKIIVFILTFLLSGIYIGNRSNKKYYFEGLKIGLINVLLFLLISLIMRNGFNIKLIIYYILIILICMLGSIIGGNIKKNKK